MGCNLSVFRYDRLHQLIRMEDFTDLKTTIYKYLTVDGTNRMVGRALAKVTRLVNDLAQEFGPATVRELALACVQAASSPVPDRINRLVNRFTVGSLYLEGQTVFGWYDQFQAQAKEVPLRYMGDSYEVNFFACPKERKLWQERGFHEAEDLPVIWRSYSSCLEVVFPVKRSLFFREYGYALPCQLQWYRDDEGFHVSRSIISAGFWCAWKWWGDAKYWYLEKRPELFADMDWWGEPSPPQRFEPIDDPYAAVLGGQ